MIPIIGHEADNVHNKYKAPQIYVKLKYLKLKTHTLMWKGCDN